MTSAGLHREQIMDSSANQRCNFAAAPQQYVDNPAFYWKLIFLLLAGANVVYFTFDDGWQTQTGRPAPALSKALAASALFLWVGVMYWGSMLPFIGNAF